MSAEQFIDAISQVTGVWQAETTEMNKADSRGQGGQLKAIRRVLDDRQQSETLLLRAALVDADALQSALGRPNREQVVTQRESIATTLEALEFTNGETLNRLIRSGSEGLSTEATSTEDIVETVYLRALGRAPRTEELGIAVEIVGSPATVEGVQDFLWAITMLPEFQFVE
jgi:hypothetical protein